MSETLWQCRWLELDKENRKLHADLAAARAERDNSDFIIKRQRDELAELRQLLGKEANDAITARAKLAAVEEYAKRLCKVAKECKTEADWSKSITAFDSEAALRTHGAALEEVVTDLRAILAGEGKK